MSDHVKGIDFPTISDFFLFEFGSVLLFVSKFIISTIYLPCVDDVPLVVSEVDTCLHCLFNESHYK